MTAWSQVKLVFVAAAAGATAVVGIFSTIYLVNEFFQKNDNNRRQKKKTQKGLYNLGNTCFANALIQSIAACPSFELWLSNVGGLISTKSISLLTELGALIRSLNYESDDDPTSADGVLAALRSHGWNITPDIEQDLFELFNVFVTTWDEELTSAWSGKSFTLADVCDLEEVSSKSHHVECLRCISESVRAQHQYRAPCVGLLGTELSCRNCGVKNVRHDRFCSLDLVLPKTSFTEISVEICLRKYFAQELLPNFKCENCQKKDNSNSTSSKRSAFFKKQGISKLPDCLILRIQRVGILPNGAPFKHVDHVKISETLCLSDFLFYREKTLEKEISIGGGDWVIRGGGDMEKHVPLIKGPQGEETMIGNDDAGDSIPMSSRCNIQYASSDSLNRINRYVYHLKAVVVHIGRPESGHFVTYRRGSGSTSSDTANNHKRKNPWFYTSDTEVKKVSFGEVASKEAYMLFYERAV